jgi:hypothetical protein
VYRIASPGATVGLSAVSDTDRSVVVDSEVLTKLVSEDVSKSVTPAGGVIIAALVTDEDPVKVPVTMTVIRPRCGNEPSVPETPESDTTRSAGQTAPPAAWQSAATPVAPSESESVNLAPSASGRLLLFITTT